MTERNDDNPFKDSDDKMSTGSSKMPDHEQKLADRIEKSLKANSDQDGNPNWKKVGETHHSTKDDKRGKK